MKLPIFYFLLIIVLHISCSEAKMKEGQNILVNDLQENDPSKDDVTPIYLTPDIMCGTVQLTDGCGPAVDSLIRFGLALIHHMTYDDAEMVFRQVIKDDPDCFWGHWGRAMTFIHPLWPDQPSQNKLVMGWALSQRALSMAKNDIEKNYGKALASYYENGIDKTEKERLAAYQSAWHTAHLENSDDLEAQLFYALSSLSLVSPNDKSYSIQKKMGALAEDVLEIIPDHPGGFHYAIHAYDFPPLANNAIRVATNYSKIAPEIPHALHMPTHIFTRLGYWDESIEMNIRSAKAAWKQPGGDFVSLHYLHALDYLVHAYLQRGETQKAKKIYADLINLNKSIQVHSASAYALAAIPARIAIDSKLWEDAAKLTVIHNGNFPWEKFPQFEAIVYFAKGIGAGRSLNVGLVSEAIDKLETLQLKLGKSPSNEYWYNQVEIQKIAVMGWQEYAIGNKELALEKMKSAAYMESNTEKNPITPGEIVQVHELLGDLLMEMEMPLDALIAYETALQNSPDRFNTLLGAGKAADLLGNKEKAGFYFKKILQNKGSGADKLTELSYVNQKI